MRSFEGDSSVLLWVASALVATLGARTFVEYLRRLHYEGPVRLWRELLLGSAALSGGLWSAMVVDISAQGLPFDVGYHPLKVFGSLALAYLAVVVLVAWVTIRPTWPSQLAVAVLAPLLAIGLQVAVIRSIGAEPGLTWRAEPLVFATLLLVIAFGVSGRMVLAAKRGSAGDRASRRLLAALVLGACVMGAQELTLIASGLDRQVVSAHARFLPEMAIALVAGAVVPVGLVLLLVDQYGQQRARASDRVRRRHKPEGPESRFADSVLSSDASDTQRPGRP